MSDKIKILNSSLTELAVISAAASALRTERINADNFLTFTARIKSGCGAYITDTSVFELSGDYFDVAYYKKEQQGDGSLIVSAEAEHVSYRLNNSIYNVDYFTMTGTSAEILAAILNGTGFAVGSVSFTDTLTFSLQEAASRRSLLMQFAAYIGGELEFSGFSVSLVTQRGSSAPKVLKVGKDITVISKAVDKRRPDAIGNPMVSYTCGVYKGASLTLGDAVTLDYEALDIDVTLRVVGKSFDPYNPNKVTVEIGNYISSLEDDLYRIETQTVAKDKIYNGIRIGPTYGFEAIRSDKRARACFRSDAFTMQTGDGSGSWHDEIYFDPVIGKYVFNGTLTANVIQAVSAIIAQTLTAQSGYIAELTVDSLETSTKIQNYLTENKADVNYIRVRGQTISFITASVDNSAAAVQATDRNGRLLYWVDNTYKSSDTAVTDYPVMIYPYIEQLKAEFSFHNEAGVYTPRIVLGVGNGVGDNGKAFIEKGVDGLSIRYIDSYANAKTLLINDDGVLIEGKKLPVVLDRNPTIADLTGYDDTLFLVYDPYTPYL
jgi:hypothetical protein